MKRLFRWISNLLHFLYKTMAWIIAVCIVAFCEIFHYYIHQIAVTNDSSLVNLFIDTISNTSISFLGIAVMGATYIDIWFSKHSEIKDHILKFIVYVVPFIIGFVIVYINTYYMGKEVRKSNGCVTLIAIVMICSFIYSFGVKFVIFYKEGKTESKAISLT